MKLLFASILLEKLKNINSREGHLEDSEAGVAAQDRSVGANFKGTKLLLFSSYRNGTEAQKSADIHRPSLLVSRMT